MYDKAMISLQILFMPSLMVLCGNKFFSLNSGRHVNEAKVFSYVGNHALQTIIQLSISYFILKSTGTEYLLTSYVKY